MTETTYVALITETRERIVGHPETHDQSVWLYAGTDDLQDMLSEEDLVEDIVTVGTSIDDWLECGTTACAAGHLVAVALQLELIDQDEVAVGHDIEDTASDLLNGYPLPDEIPLEHSNTRTAGLFHTNFPTDRIVTWMDQVISEELV